MMAGQNMNNRYGNRQSNAAGKVVIIMLAFVLAACLLWIPGAVVAWIVVRDHIGPDATRLWAMVATLLVPAGAWLGYRIGQNRAKDRLAGLDMGVRKVMASTQEMVGVLGQAANQAADVKARVVQNVLQPPPIPNWMNVTVGPARAARQLGAGDDEIITLE